MNRPTREYLVIHVLLGTATIIYMGIIAYVLLFWALP